jgi:uncharacterized protein YdhG (YjbR/CyaY superfamily)
MANKLDPMDIKQILILIKPSIQIKSLSLYPVVVGITNYFKEKYLL